MSKIPMRVLCVSSLLLGVWLGFGGRSINSAATTPALAEVSTSAATATEFQTVAIQDIVAGQFVTVGLPDGESQPLPEDTLTEKAPKQEATGVTEWMEYPGDAFVPYPIRIAVRDGVIVDVDGKDTNASLRDLISTKYIVGDADGTDVTRLLCRTIDLEMPKPDGSIAELSVIRPLWWLQGTEAAVGGSIDIGLHEIGLSGEATVLAIGPCDVDSRETRPGMSIVTGKIRHRNASVWDLTFDDRTEETLGVTANHPLYSETRHAWIPAGDLQLDEVVRTLNGHSTLTARTQRPTRETVFNIEVHRSHAYHVSGLGVLAHNTCVTWSTSRKGAFDWDHIFSEEHLRSGIMNLGRDKSQIMESISDAVHSASQRGLLRAGPNQIETVINGQKATIRAFFDAQGNLVNINACPGISARKLGNLISL